MFPEHLLRASIKDVILGEQVYVAPWALLVDQHGQPWLRGDYDFSADKFGTQRMKIKRVARGFEVQIPQGAQYDQTCLTRADHIRMNLQPVASLRW